MKFAAKEPQGRDFASSANISVVVKVRQKAFG